jgi:hypothetical protein
VHVTPELCVAMRPREARAVIARVRRAFAKYPQRELDGVRVDFCDGWAMVCRCVPESAVAFRFEAGDFDGLAELVWRFRGALPEIGDALWTRFQHAMGAPQDDL